MRETIRDGSVVRRIRHDATERTVTGTPVPAGPACRFPPPVPLETSPNGPAETILHRGQRGVCRDHLMRLQAVPRLGAPGSALTIRRL